MKRIFGLSLVVAFSASCAQEDAALEEGGSSELSGAVYMGPEKIANIAGGTPCYATKESAKPSSWISYVQDSLLYGNQTRGDGPAAYLTQGGHTLFGSPVWLLTPGKGGTQGKAYYALKHPQENAREQRNCFVEASKAKSLAKTKLESSGATLCYKAFNQSQVSNWAGFVAKAKAEGSQTRSDTYLTLQKGGHTLIPGLVWLKSKNSRVGDFYYAVKNKECFVTTSSVF